MLRALLADKFGIGLQTPDFQRSSACPTGLDSSLWPAYVWQRRKGGLAPFYVRKTATHIIRVFRFQCYIVKEYTGYNKKSLANEVAVLQQLHHDCLVSFLFAVDEGARFSLVMEWAGQGLRGLVEQQTQQQMQQQMQQETQLQTQQQQVQQQQQSRPVAEEIARHVTYQLTNSLLYLQHKGIVHRDIKPDNIGVMPDLSVKLLDFGEALLLDQLASLTDQQLAKAVGVAGTPLFMPPEMLLYLTQGRSSSGSNGGSSGSNGGWSQPPCGAAQQQRHPEGVASRFWGRLRTQAPQQQQGQGQQQQQQQGQQLGSLRQLTSHKLDVWGLGCTVYFLLAGRDVLQQDCGYELADMAEVVNASSGIRLPPKVQVSAEARAFLARCLERDPRKRATAKELMQHPWLAGAAGAGGAAAAAAAALAQQVTNSSLAAACRDQQQLKPQVTLDTDVGLAPWPRGVDAIAAHRGLLHPTASGTASSSSSSAPNTPLSGVAGLAQAEASGF